MIGCVSILSILFLWCQCSVAASISVAVPEVSGEDGGGMEAGYRRYVALVTCSPYTRTTFVTRRPRDYWHSATTPLR